MNTPVNQEDLNSQEEYFHHLNITSWKEDYIGNTFYIFVKFASKRQGS